MHFKVFGNIRFILLFYIFITLLGSSMPAYSQQHKRIYIAPDDHTDLFWTADLETYDQAFLIMLDYYIDLSYNTRHEPHIHQSRWNCDGSYWMWVYEKNRSPEQFQRLIAYINSGHISVPLNPLAVVWGSAPAEAVIRGMYYPGKIERKYNIRLPLVYSMENQTLPLGLATIWKGAGAKYSWKGVCQCNTQLNARNRDHEIYWMQGLDKSKILMKWYSLSNQGEISGTTPWDENRGFYGKKSACRRYYRKRDFFRSLSPAKKLSKNHWF